MDAVKFLKERERMCLIYKACDGCPLQESDLCLDEGENAEAIVKTVEKWSAEHPVKTRLMDFLEKHPRAFVDTDGTPLYYPSMLGYCGERDHIAPCAKCEHRYSGARHCWDLPLEE